MTPTPDHPDTIYVECLASNTDATKEDMADLFRHLQEVHGLAEGAVLKTLRVVQGRVPASGLAALYADPLFKAVLTHDEGDPFRLPRARQS
jgi:hypothetical protein